MLIVLFTGPMGIRNPYRESVPQSRAVLACSPPYKRVRALRLFDSPATPKTLVEKSTMHTPVPTKCTRLFPPDKPRSMSSGFLLKPDKPTANVNPFTPNGMLITARKRSRSKRSLIGLVFIFTIKLNPLFYYSIIPLLIFINFYFYILNILDRRI